MVPIKIYEDDPNTDINYDSNGRPGNIDWSLSSLDIASGMITLTVDGDPLLDGDRVDDWFDYDPSGNMTIDFGFYEEAVSVNVNRLNETLAKIYPNPFNDFIMVETKSYENHTITIMSATGQVVFQSPLSAKASKIGIGDFASGMYIVVLKNKDGEIKWAKNLMRTR